MLRDTLTPTTAPAIAAYANAILDSGTSVFVNYQPVAEGTRVGNSPDHGLVFTSAPGVTTTVPRGEHVIIDIIDLDA